MKTTIDLTEKEVKELDNNINLLYSATDAVSESEDEERLNTAIEFAIEVLKRIKPKKTFSINIERSAVETFEVEAESLEEAEELALKEAYNTDWASSEAEYRAVK